MEEQGLGQQDTMLGQEEEIEEDYDEVRTDRKGASGQKKGFLGAMLLIHYVFLSQMCDWDHVICCLATVGSRRASSGRVCKTWYRKMVLRVPG